MSRQNYVFTSESVSEGHPDKICDQISDSIVDAFLAEEPESRVAVEALCTTNRVILAGEVRGPKHVTRNLTDVARETIKTIGYDQDCFSWRNAEITNLVHEQSVDIAKGVDSDLFSDKDEGAGDQGIMFGYATRETPVYMPAPIYYSHRILHDLSDRRHNGLGDKLGPDAKSQVTLKYENGIPVAATSVVVSTQHMEDIEQNEIREIVRESAEKILPVGWMPSEEKFYVNPTGRFVIGGPDGDTGLTGRKIIVDTYGGAAPHGGGAFSGKDPTKVDRSAAYACRYLAKNVVAAGLADRCVIQVSYAIGVSEPLSVYVDLENGKAAPAVVETALRDLMDLRPRGIREHLKLNQPIYQRTASYGHFGRDPKREGGFLWENLDLVEQLKGLISV